LTIVTVEPLTVHVDVVCDAKVTGKPDDAVALTANGGVPNACPLNVPKVMVWLPLETVKLWLTLVAGA
jgi:hypothetical protein